MSVCQDREREEGGLRAEETVTDADLQAEERGVCPAEGRARGQAKVAR